MKYIESRHVTVAADIDNGVTRLCADLAALLTKARSQGFPTEHLEKLANLRQELVCEANRIGRLGIDRYLAERRGEEFSK
jgi:hypothetical protein